MASNIIVNLDTGKSQYNVYECKQNDDLTLEANIFENGIELDITTKEVTINCTKSDGTFVIQSTDIVKEGNKILADLFRDFTRVDGLDKLEIVLIENGKQNTTFDFNILVKPSVIKGAVESENTATILEELGNKIVEAGQAKAETENLIATGNAATKGDIATVNTQLEQKAKDVDVKLLEERMNQFTSLPTGSTTGDAELLDGRIDKNGKTYSNIGNAIRTQVKKLDENIKDLYIVGDNLFNYKKNKANTLLNLQTGVETENANYVTSGFIEVLPLTKYTIRHFAYLFFFNNAEGFISKCNDSFQNSYTFTTPENCTKIRFCINITSSNNVPFVTENVVSLEDKYKTNNTKYKIYKSDNFADSEKYLGSDNLIKDYINGYIRKSDGVLLSSDRYKSSHFIEVDENTMYYPYNCRPDFIAFFDKNGNYVQNTKNLINPFKPSDYGTGIKYIRVTGYDKTFGLFTRKVIKPKPYKEIIKPSLVDYTQPYYLEVFLPDKFYVAVGVKIEIQNSDIVGVLNSDDLYFKWSSDVGTNLKDKFVIEGKEANIGTHELTLEIYDKFLNLMFVGKTNLIISPVISKNLKVCAIGDSLTNGKPWINEIVRLSNNKISFVGTRWHDVGSDSNSLIKHEGRSGFRASQYNSNTSYTFDTDGVGSENPFFNPSTNKFDWNYYKTTYSINPDVVQLFLGTNGLNLEPQAEVDAMKNMVNTIRTQDANVKIFVVYPIHCADQNGCGSQANTDGYSSASGLFEPIARYSMFNYIRQLKSELSGISNIEFIPVMQTFDHKNNFKTKEVPVNPRSTKTETIVVEGIHPENYMQIADTSYSALCYV